ncbi:gephyrin-like molybdotransferase Glp [Bdellovibrionota bacterium FG-1]
MIPYLEAISILKRLAAPRALSSEQVLIECALGRILSEDVLSPECVPSFTNSAMDGFAVCAAQTRGATENTPVRLKVVGMVAAGDQVYGEKPQEGAAIEIMTGAPLPEGGGSFAYDAVVKIEDVIFEKSLQEDSVIVLKKPLSPGENVRERGTDFAVGQKVLNHSTRFRPEHLMACAGLGICEVNVRRQPKIAVISTGNELVDRQQKTLTPGMIRNSTGPFLLAALQAYGADIRDYGIVRDRPEDYQAILKQAIHEGADLVISTGAVSMGKYDFVTEVLEKIGARIAFHKAAIRPGKPICVAEFEEGRGPVFFGVPGNPVSTAVGLRFFIDPYLRTLCGLEPEVGSSAILAREVRKPRGLRCFFKARTQVHKGTLGVEVLRGQASYVVSSLLEANAWVVLPEDVEQLTPGSELSIYPLHHSFSESLL